MNSIHIRFVPSKKQEIAWDHLNDKETIFIGYGGAAYGGKSWLLCYWLTIMSLAYPNTAWGLGRRELTTLKRTTLMTLFKVFKECGINPDEHYNYNQQINLITFFNGSQIFLIDTAYKPTDPLYTRFGGYELTGLGIDESAETAFEAIEILSTRCGRRLNGKYNLPKKILETFNPDKGHVYRRYYQPYKNGTLPKTFKFVPALPKDNPSGEAEAYVQSIISTASQVTIQRLIYGNFEYEDDPTRLFETDHLLDMFTMDHKPSDQKYLTVDVARFGNDKTVIFQWEGLHVKKIYSYDQTSTKFIREKIESLCSEHQIQRSKVIVDEDGVGGGVVDETKGIKGFVNNSRQIDDKDSRKPLNYANLKTQCYFALADLVLKGKISVYKGVNEHVKETLIGDLEQIKRKDPDKDGKIQLVPKDKIKEMTGRSPDYADAMMMRMYFEINRKDQSFFFG